MVAALYPQEDSSYRLSRPQGHSAAWRIRSSEKSDDLIGNRTRDLPEHQPTTLLHAPILKWILKKYNRKVWARYIISRQGLVAGRLNMELNLFLPSMGGIVSFPSGFSILVGQRQEGDLEARIWFPVWSPFHVQKTPLAPSFLSKELAHQEQGRTKRGLDNCLPFAHISRIRGASLPRLLYSIMVQKITLFLLHE
jgi:hypothetical protein